MFLVVGLGNPGRVYEKTRHNAGFMALDELHRRAQFPEYKSKFSGLWAKGILEREDGVLLKPSTFMNLSGDSVQPAVDFLKVETARLIVLHDELDVPFGEVRLKVGGGHAGHNGLRSIIARLGTPDFIRVRIGIGRPPPHFRGDIADFVLQSFDPPEQSALSLILDRAVDGVMDIARDGITPAMNRANTRPTENQKSKA